MSQASQPGPRDGACARASRTPYLSQAVPGDEWKTWPGFASYEASHRGMVRSVDRRLRDGRRRRGVVLKTRIGSKGYVLVDVRDDDGVKRTRTLHSLVLAAHAGPRPPGTQARHLDDNPLDNRWPENLRWGTREENEADRARNSGRAPQPERRRWPHRAFVTLGDKLRR